MDVRRAIPLVLVAAACGAGPATSAYAADQVVANSNDTGGGSLRQAIADVGAGETVTIPGSVGPIILTSGELVVAKSMTINGAGAATTSVSGNDASRVFRVTAPATLLTLSGMTVRDGFTAAIPGGGGILMEAGSLTLNNVVVRENVANIAAVATFARGGGGIYGSTGAITLNGSTVADNTATVSTTDGCCHGGGGIFANGPVSVAAGSTMDGNAFTLTGPTASSGTECCSGGGAIVEKANSPITVGASTMSDNTATINGESCCHGGGAILNIGNLAVTVTNSVLSGNQATVNGQPGSVPNESGGCCSGGGAINSDQVNLSGSALTQNTATVSSGNCCHGAGAVLAGDSGANSIVDTTISQNIANVTTIGCCSGGGGLQVVVVGAAPPLITNSLFSANQAILSGGPSNSGGGAIHSDSTGPLNIVNSTFTGNSTSIASATQGGGAIYLDGDSIGTPNLFANVTIADNSAPSGVGGGLFLDDPLEATNSIIAANTASDFADCTAGPDPLTSLGYNLGVTSSSCPLTATGDQQVAPTALGLTPLAANGGPTQTRALDNTSPAIGGGNPAGCTDQVGAPLTTDQRGQSRPNPGGSSCDIGAFESSLAPPENLPVVPPANPPVVPPANPPASPPSNAFTFGKLKLNKKKGTATLAVTVPGPGELALGGKDIKPQRPVSDMPGGLTKPVAAAGETTLTIKAKGKAKKALKKKGKARLTATVTFTPSGGTPSSQDQKVKLKRKRK